MKMIALASLAAVALGIGAAFILSASQQKAYEAYVTSGARVSEPGHNLVGQRWNGDPDVKRGGRSG